MSKTSIVLELQLLATDGSNDITNLLRKALLVAYKLNQEEFKVWINNELHGYKELDIPDYRKISTEIKVKNPHRGLIPFIINDQRIADIFKNVEIKDPIESLDNLLKYPSSEKFCIIEPSDYEQNLLMGIQDGYKLPAVKIIGRNQVAAIVDAVRSTILEWVLRLESEGIVGDGISFSKTERNKAMNSSTINIKNFQGVLGDVSDSNVHQHLNITINKNDFDSLSRCLDAEGVSKDDLKELQIALSEDQPPTNPGTFGSKVSDWVGKMIGKACSGSWKIGIGAASNLLATTISKYYGL